MGRRGEEKVIFIKQKVKKEVLGSYGTGCGKSSVTYNFLHAY